MNCIIINSDPISSELLKICIERTDFLRLKGICPTIKEAIEIIKTNGSNLVFLDMTKPDVKSIDFLNIYPDLIPVIIVSDKKDFAVKAYDLNVIDYILKPIKYNRFLLAVNKACRKANNLFDEPTFPDFIFIRHNRRYKKVSFSEIIYIESNADYSIIHTDGGQFTFRAAMKELEIKFAFTQLIRAHRKYIVNMDKVTALGGDELYLTNIELPMGRNYKQHLKDRLVFM